MKHDTIRTLDFENATDPGRPLRLAASAGRLEVRMGRTGITDTVITLDASQARRLADWIGEALR